MEQSNSSLPKYEQIMQDLLQQIRSGNFTYDVPICTERQLCDDYDVSRITAKRAITELEHRGVLFRKRGAGSFVVRNAANNLDTASPVTVTDSKTIAFLLPFDISKGGVFVAVEAVNHVLNEKGYFLSIHISSPSFAKEKNNLKLLLSQNISGLIYYPIRDKINLNLLNDFVFQGKPVVVMDKDINCPYIHNVISDNFQGGWLLAEHLVSLGHKNIAFVTTAPIDDTSSVRNRFGGYLRYLQSIGIKPSPGNLVYFPYQLTDEADNNPDYDTYCHQLKQLHDSGISAIICENDQVAYFSYKAFKRLGLSVPKDISICGFDNNEWSLRPEAGITTINQDFPSIGEKIGEVLLESVKNPSAQIQRITLPVSLVVRGSTGPRE